MAEREVGARMPMSTPGPGYQASVPQRAGAPAGKGSTFSKREADEIAKGNFALLQRMASLQQDGRKGGNFSLNAACDRRHASSSAINRKRHDEQVARENQELSKRLQGARSS